MTTTDEGVGSGEIGTPEGLGVLALALAGAVDGHRRALGALVLELGTKAQATDQRAVVEDHSIQTKSGGINKSPVCTVFAPEVALAPCPNPSLTPALYPALPWK